MELRLAPDPPVAWQGLLGYLNFSDGRPDAKFQGQFHAAVQFASDKSPAGLANLLDAELATLRAGGSSAFKDTTQATATIRLALRELPPAYRAHHTDLLAGVGDDRLFTAFFLARVCEAVLAVRAAQPGASDRALIRAALGRLNDYVGYRPVAVLETKPAGTYDHERLRPVPVYLRGVGVAAGPYQALIAGALEILATADADLLDDAQFELELLDELALDPRPYDHNHPVNRRPNYVFGEWDPHHLDNQGRHRRFVVRQTTLDAMLYRVTEISSEHRPERVFEAAAVLAGTVVMAAAIGGRSPTSHDSGNTLSTLIPKIAKLRDDFYNQLLAHQPEGRRERLQREASQSRQPFGHARQHLNGVLAQERAVQVQERELSILFARLGYPQASRQRAASIATASVRAVSEARVGLTTALLFAERGQLADAAAALPAVEAVLQRGIACGALADPWNMLGFQGLFPLFQAREDSIHDPRIDELLELVRDLLDVYGRLLSDAAALGQADVSDRLSTGLRRVADWWDQYAGYEVRDLPRVYGAETADAAEHVASALAEWRDRTGSDTARTPQSDLAFWKERREGFKTPGAFARVVRALLDRGDRPAAMALLLAWVDLAEEVPLVDGDHSFHPLAVRWVEAAVAAGEPVRKFFDYLEPTAEDYWDVPELADAPRRRARSDDDDEEEFDDDGDGSDLFEAAREGVTFRDSTDDGNEGALMGDVPPSADFGLEHQEDELRQRLLFLATSADLWRIAAPALASEPAVLRAWLETARDRERRLLTLLEQLHNYAVPEPLGTFESVVEFDQRRELKEQITEQAIAAGQATARAIRALRGHANEAGVAPAGWEPFAVTLEREVERGDAELARKALRKFLPRFRKEPLLYVPLAAGGHPHQVLRCRVAQSLLQTLLDRLPRLGLLRETFALLQTARQMEQSSPPAGRKVTEFDRLFPIGLQASVEVVVETYQRDRPNGGERELLELLRWLTGPYLNLWVEHSQSLRLSVLETVSGAAEWERVREFVSKFGREVFTAPFLTLANLRAILHRGVNSWIDTLPQQDNPPERLLAALEQPAFREAAVRHMELVLQAVVENYEEYRDYNSTTTQSDYGENLYTLIDFLRLKTQYERDNWRLRPLVLAHEVLCRLRRTHDAVRWQDGIADHTRTQAEQRLGELAHLEGRHGIRLRTVRDRVGERFVAPLAIDRLCALLEPAWKAARSGGDENHPAFAALLKELDAFAATPSGVGLDVPPWLRRLDREIDRLAEPAIPSTGRPVPKLALAELRRQLEQDWNRPLDAD